MTDLNQTLSEEAVLYQRGYKFVKKLGEGSYAKVYLSEYKSETERDKNRKLACKVIDTTRAPKDFVKKFLPRELDILVKVNHPHVVHVHSIFQRRAKYFMFMRYAENGDLLEFILKNGAVQEGQARVWIRQLTLGSIAFNLTFDEQSEWLVEGSSKTISEPHSISTISLEKLQSLICNVLLDSSTLQYLHEMEIAHRDVKCENVLLTSNYNVKLADFGFARYVIDDRGKQVLSDTYCGSLSYIAPEILRGSPYSPKMSDIWSLGVILYILLNKAMPFDDTDIKRLYVQQRNRKWKFRTKVVSQLSEQVKRLITAILEPDPLKRLRLDQIMSSEWIAMDSRLLTLSPAEQTALASAQEERKKMEEKFSRRDPKMFKVEEKSKVESQQPNKGKQDVTVIKKAGNMALSSITDGPFLNNV